MSQASEKLVRLIAPVVTGLGYEMVGVEWAADTRGRRVLRVYIDIDDGVSVDDCEKVSNQLSALMDVENPIPGTYMLEVSSPGLDRPLFTLDHYRRFIGSEVRLLLTCPMNGQRRFKGVIKNVKGDSIVLQTAQGEELTFSFETIDKARLVPDYTVIMKGQSR